MKTLGLLLAMGILGGCATQWNHPGQDLCLNSDIFITVDGNHGLSAGRYKYSHSLHYRDFYTVEEGVGMGRTVAKTGEPLTPQYVSVHWLARPEIELSTEEQRPIHATMYNLYRCDS